jgi:nitrate/sulfonate/bicarbonate ABC superfamily ATP binding cassette transporter, binding protein
MKKALEQYYQVLFASNPKSVGGALPEEGFYAEP